MKMCAKTCRKLNQTEHKIGLVQEEGTVNTEDLPVAVRVEIMDEGNGVYLYRYDADGKCVGDTWHLTLIEAKNQAQFEYGIADDDWTEI